MIETRTAEERSTRAVRLETLLEISEHIDLERSILLCLWDEPRDTIELLALLRDRFPLAWENNFEQLSSGEFNDESLWGMLDSLIERRWVIIRRGLYCLTAPGRAMAAERWRV